MRINNLTTFRTADLKTIAARVALEELDSHQRRGITVHFVPRRSRSDAARAARFAGFRQRCNIGIVPAGLRYNQALVRVGSQQGPSGLALLLAHEFSEMRGRSHKDMRTPRYFFRPGWRERYAWAIELPLRQTAKNPKPRLIGAALAADRQKHAEAKLAEWARRLKRAQTGYRKWRTTVKYYERRARLLPNTTEEKR